MDYCWPGAGVRERVVRLRHRAEELLALQRDSCGEAQVDFGAVGGPNAVDVVAACGVTERFGTCMPSRDASRDAK